MSEVFEELRREGYEEGAEWGIEQGIERGVEQTRVSSVRSLMEKLQMSAQQALEVLGVPAAEWPRYLDLLKA